MAPCCERPAVPRLLAVSPPDAATDGGAAFLRALSASLDAGLPGVLLRLPGASDRSVLALGSQVRERVDAARSGARFLLHDRVHLASALGADGVHLGGGSLPVARAREVCGTEALVGVSLHAGAAAAESEGADYAFLGPLRPSPSKPVESPARLPALPEEEWALAGQRHRVPLLALGGVAPSDLGDLAGRGLHGVAAISAIFSAPNPGAATEAFLRGLAGWSR